VKKLTNNFSKKVRSPVVGRTQRFLLRCSFCPSHCWIGLWRQLITNSFEGP